MINNKVKNRWIKYNFWYKLTVITKKKEGFVSKRTNISRLKTQNGNYNGKHKIK